MKTGPACPSLPLPPTNFIVGLGLPTVHSRHAMEADFGDPTCNRRTTELDVGGLGCLPSTQDMLLLLLIGGWRPNQKRARFVKCHVSARRMSYHTVSSKGLCFLSLSLSPVHSVCAHTRRLMLDDGLLTYAKCGGTRAVFFSQSGTREGIFNFQEET